MNGLVISTIGKVFIYVVRNNKYTYYDLSAEQSAKSSEELLPLIKQTMEKENLNISDLNFIAVANGIGSFTGVRVGLVTAKILADVLNCKLIVFNNLEVLAFAEKNLNKNKETLKLCEAYASGAFGYFNNKFVYYNKTDLNNIKLSDTEILISDLEATYFENFKYTKLNYLQNLTSLINLKLDTKSFSDVFSADAVYVVNSQAENELEEALKNVRVEKADASDSANLYIIEKQCFNENIYTENMLKEELNAVNKKYSKVLFKDKVVGFVGFSIIEGEAELLKIAILPAHRGKGLSKILFEKATKDINYKKIFLEVNKNNEIAISLYKRLGFKEISRRLKYYDNGDDAIIFELNK